MERKYLQLLLAGTLLLAACEQEVSAMGEGNNIAPTNTFVPTEVPTLQANALTPYLLDVETPEPVVQAENSPIAEDCIMPFENATWNTGLRFVDRFYNTKTNHWDHHLGHDIKGLEGTPIVNVCNGTLMYAGESYKGSGLNLGNIVVIKYDYFDNGESKTVYGLYAHMKNVILDIPVGTIIKKGDQIGELSHSGGWPENHNHLHFQIINERGKQDLEEFGKHNYGNGADKFWSYYPEEWPVGQIGRDFIDPKVWLTSLLPK